MRAFRIVQVLPNKNIYYLQERKTFILWHYWRYMKEEKHYYTGSDWEIVKFHSVEQAEAYVKKIVAPPVVEEVCVVKTMVV